MATIFYAWQNDTPAKLNRYFVRDAIDRALVQIRSDGKVQDAPELDYDTKGVTGTPNIAETIFTKIAASSIFVADVTFVGRTTQDEGPGYPKRLPNANVLIELGMAAASIGWGRIVLIMNTVFGHPADLPFDLRHRRYPLQYELGMDMPKASTRKLLTSHVREALAALLPAAPTSQRVVPEPQSEYSSDQPPNDVVYLIRQRAERDFPADISTRRYQINNELDAWRALASLRVPRGVPEEAFRMIREQAAQDFPQNFSTQLYQLRQEFEAYRELQAFHPSGLPQQVIEQITRKARADFPRQYSTQLYQAKQEASAWKDLYGR